MAYYSHTDAQRVRQQDMSEVHEYYRRRAEQHRGEVRRSVARLTGSDAGQ